MLNPKLTQKEETFLTVNENTKKIFQLIYKEKIQSEEVGDDKSKIKVSELISKMAFYYEKIRNSVDYKEDHLLRKNAIERILKRQIVIQASKKGEEIAKHLLSELIRGSYLPNNKLPEEKIIETGFIIEKYIKLKKTTSGQIRKTVEENQENTTNWIISMCACEIEENVNVNLADKIIVDQMYKILAKDIKLPLGLPFEKDKEVQIFIGIYRNYMKYDDSMIDFLLLKYYQAGWLVADDKMIENLGKKIYQLRQAINRQANHPLAGQLNRIIGRYTVFYSILTDIIKEDPTGVYQSFKTDSKAFPRMIKKACNKRYGIAKQKLSRAAVRSIIYIFLTKMVLAVVLEVPATLWLGEIINYTSLIINISFPPLLLFFIVLFTRVPSEDNTEKIVKGINEIVFIEKQRQEPFILRQPAKRGKTINVIFGLIYAVTFFLSFGLVIWFLEKIHFTYVSILIFLFFLTVVSFFGIRIRKVARELVIVERKESFINFIMDFFYIPIVAVGKWLSVKFSRINVFVFILDFIIEAPFKIFVEIAEEWTKYIKERKEEII
jgi:hypothetical protein